MQPQHLEQWAPCQYHVPICFTRAPGWPELSGNQPTQKHPGLRLFLQRRHSCTLGHHPSPLTSCRSKDQLMPRHTRLEGRGGAAWHPCLAMELPNAGKEASQPSPSSCTWTRPTHPHQLTPCLELQSGLFFPFAFGFQEYLMGRVRANSPPRSLSLKIQQVLWPSLAKPVSCSS